MMEKRVKNAYKTRAWRKWILLAAVLGLLLALGGCAPQTPPTGNLPPEDSAENQAPQEEVPDILPVVEESMVDQREVTLYFRMKDEDMLAAETRTLLFPSDKQIEYVLVEALTGGPSANLLELNGLFSPGAKVYKVWDSNNMLTVLMTYEFLQPPSGAPVMWENDPEWSREVYVRRQLALASIVNTITEATNYTSVQVLVLDRNEELTGRRMTRAEVYEGASPEQLLAPLKRNEGLILTHYNTANVIMESWKGQTFDRLYRFVAQNDAKRPTEATFLSEMRDLARRLTYYDLSAGVVSQDGQSAVIEASYEYMLNGNTIQVQNFPLRLTRENGQWRIAYAELRRMMEAQ